jgi:phytoene dehydrogenase-like protein
MPGQARHRRFEGLFCVGAAAHPGAGLAFVGLGAALAAQLIGPAERVRG